ncbi:hypothetical protein [Pseudomonas japonica]|uniref:hypothetical protein n=1 Tax=Pseudomonas japonica TaxID=256466 RepID=UPI003A8ABA2F
MSADLAHARIGLEIARIAKSSTPAHDRTFVEGMIEMAACLSQITYEESESYRQALAIKAGNRIAALRNAA